MDKYIVKKCPHCGKLIDIWWEIEPADLTIDLEKADEDHKEDDEQ